MEIFSMVTFFRIIRAGFVSFRRNIWLSSATVMVLVLSLSVALSILLVGVIADGVVNELESRVDISVYFKPDTSEEDIQNIKDAVERFPEVTQTRYTSRDEALTRFKERHAENDTIQTAIAELPGNPLEASLSIQAVNASAYEAIASYIEGKFGSAVSKVNYRENATIIQRIFSVTNALRVGGAALGFALFVIAGLISFNTIRLAIFSARDEVAVMRLVGGSNWFIRGPFLIEGILSGIIAAFITFAIFWGIADMLASPIARFVPGVDLPLYYRVHWSTILGILAGLGVFTPVLSSFIAIRRYLRV